MRLTVVGCSGSLSRARLAGVLLPARARRPTRIVLDLGNGALGALQRYVDLDDIDAVVLSATCTPTTASTCAATTSCASTTRTGRGRAIPVYGPTGTAERMARAYDLADDPA